MVTRPIIYVEGRSNKVFYQQLIELNDKFVDNGGSCIDINRKVDSENNSYGIVDHDYSEINHEKLFPINFYSLENISLIYIQELDDLRESIEKYIIENTLKTVSIHKADFKMYHDKTKRVKGYHIILSSRKHHDQFNEYILNKIVCEKTFMRYKDIKKVVEQYIKFYKSKYSVKVHHIIDLAEYLPSKSIKHIFDKPTLERLNKII